MPEQSSKPTTDAHILAKALLRASAELGLTREQLASAIGTDSDGIAQISDQMHLDSQSPSGQLAVLVIRLARSMRAQCNGDENWIHNFMRTPNSMIGAVPCEAVTTEDGLRRVVYWLETIGNNGCS